MKLIHDFIKQRMIDYKKIGTDKIIYASDYPYVDLKESQRIFFEFIDKWGFTSSQFEKMAFSNGMKIADLNG